MEPISIAVKRVPTAGLQRRLEKTSCPSNSHCWNKQVFPLSSHPQNNNLKFLHQSHTKLPWDQGAENWEEVFALWITWDFFFLTDVFSELPLGLPTLFYTLLSVELNDMVPLVAAKMVFGNMDQSTKGSGLLHTSAGGLQFTLFLRDSYTKEQILREM